MNKKIASNKFANIRTDELTLIPPTFFRNFIPPTRVFYVHLSSCYSFKKIHKNLYIYIYICVYICIYKTSLYFRLKINVKTIWKLFI